MIFVFGFLPWSEVSCNSKEVTFQLTQSGYQALYGGVSAPPAVEALLAEQASKRLDPGHAPPENVQELRNKLRVEQAYLANVSPFLVLFWGTNFALLGIICYAPLGTLRLGFVLPLCGVMLGVLLFHACLGLPLERRAGQIIAAAMREDDSKGILFLAFKSSKSVWFWLTLASVGLLAATEPLLSWFRAEHLRAWGRSTGIAGAASVLVLIGVLAQFAFRETVVSDMENRIIQLQRAEEEKRRRAEAQEREWEATRRAEVRKQEAETQRLRQQAALEEQKARLLEARRRREREEEERRILLEQRRQEAEARRKAEQEAKEEAAREAGRQAEAERKAKEEAAREAARKAELEKKGLPYYPLPLTPYEERNAQEWYQLLDIRPNNARVWAQATKALVALKGEGMPFLLQHLTRQTTAKDRSIVLQLIQVEYVHPNDLHKLLPCLEQGKAFNGTRLLALSYLERRVKDLPKKLVPEIERLVEDMLTNSGFKEKTKQDIRSKLATIRMVSE